MWFILTRTNLRYLGTGTHPCSLLSRMESSNSKISNSERMFIIFSAHKSHKIRSAHIIFIHDPAQVVFLRYTLYRRLLIRTTSLPFPAPRRKRMVMQLQLLQRFRLHGTWQSCLGRFFPWSRQRRGRPGERQGPAATEPAADCILLFVVVARSNDKPRCVSILGRSLAALSHRRLSPPRRTLTSCSTSPSGPASSSSRGTPPAAVRVRGGVRVRVRVRDRDRGRDRGRVGF